MFKNKTNNKTSLLWIAKNSKSQLVSIILVTIFYVLLAIIGVYSALIVKSAVDSATNSDMDGVIFYGAIYAGVLLATLLLRILTRNLYFIIGAKLTKQFRKNIFEMILNKDYYEVSGIHSGKLLNLITSDIGIVVDAMVSIMPTVSFMITKLIGVLVVLLSIDLRFSIIFIVGGVVLILVSEIFKKKMKKLYKKVQETEGETRSFFQEIIAGLLVVKVFNAEKKVSQKADNLQDENYKIKAKSNFISIFATSSFTFLFSVAYLYGLMWGSINIVNGLITFGTLTAILSLITQIQTPVSELSSVMPKYYAALASAERLMNLEDIKEDTKVNDSKISITKLYEDLNFIKFDNISFKYDREIILNNTDLTINKGDFTVIMGISGIGKSTLTKLLMGVYPLSEGQIYFEKTNGEKIYAYKDIRKIFSYVPQGNFLLSGTIRENIMFANATATKDEVNIAVEISCVNQFLKDLPDGLDTKIGERGQGLSEGQVQRIAIARAILTKSPIIILDEATSALDEDTEKKVLENIKALKNRTCIIVSHKKAAEKVCNRHIKIIEGKIIEVGKEALE